MKLLIRELNVKHHERDIQFGPELYRNESRTNKSVSVHVKYSTVKKDLDS